MTLNQKINQSSFNKNKEVSHMKLKENSIQMSGRKWLEKNKYEYGKITYVLLKNSS